MSSVKVSVVVPIYNAENFIQDTLEMLCRSTLEDIEILAINDGSTDNTLSVLKKSSKKDSRIKVIDKPNGGIYDARNRGLEEARGDYICFCDQDDVVEPQMYEKMYKKVSENHSELAMCSTGKFSDGVKYPDRIIPNDVIELDNIRRKCFLPLIFNKSTYYRSEVDIDISDNIWKCMISREFIDAHHLMFKKYINFEDDRTFLLEALSKAHKVVLISDILYYWRVNLESESHEPKYVDNMYEKDLIYQDKVKEIMKVANCKQDEIHSFEMINSANRYARLTFNEAYHKSTPLKERIAIIEAIYLEDDFNLKANAADYFLKNMFARKIICRFLKGHHTELAYDFCKFYISVRKKFQTKPFWIKIEKKASYG